MSISLSASSMLNQLNSTGTYSYKTSKNSKIVDEKKFAAKETCIMLNTSVRTLRNTTPTTVGGKTKAKKHIKNVLSAINDLMDSSAASSKKSKRAVEKLSNLFDEYEDELKDIGITKSSSGKYSLDNSKWENIDEETLTDAYNKLFGKDSDFSKGIVKYNNTLKSIMNENLVQTKTVTLNNSVSIDKNRIAMAGSANNITSCISSLTSSDCGSKEALAYISEIIDNFNTLFAEEKEAQSNSEYLDTLSNLVLSHKTDLNSIGLDCSNDGTSLSFYNNNSDTCNEKIDDAKNLFEKKFGDALSSASQKLFCDLLETTGNNISVNEYL